MIRSTCACHTGTVAVMACGFGCALNWRNGAMAASRARLSHRFSPVDAALNTDSSAPLLGQALLQSCGVEVVGYKLGHGVQLAPGAKEEPVGVRLVLHRDAGVQFHV